MHFLYKIEIDEGNKHKQFFEKGLGALLADPYFLLLYVPEDGGKMQVIQPVSHSYHHERFIKRIHEAKGVPSFYYALSHLWGISKDNRHLWYDISEYVDDEEGEPMEPISMRPEKRDTLLRLLRDHPDSYWWIDVLCARTNTPLDIMGDIYSCCLECIAMIDCEPNLIPQINTMKDVGQGFPSMDSALHHPVLREYLTELNHLFGERHFKLAKVISTLLQSQWWQRVWT